MPRLFASPRDIDFINDISKELHKDIIGQKIYYYKVRSDLTESHDVYEEAIEKVYDPPVEIECRIDWNPQDTTTNQFGSEKRRQVTVFLHQRDLLDRDIKVEEGDYFSYGDTFFEITEAVTHRQIFGQVEHVVGYRLLGQQARKGKINFRPLGPTDERYTDDDAVQEEFVQQRGFAENRLGPTGDKRDLQEKETLTEPISGPHEVSKRGGTIDSTFYGDE